MENLRMYQMDREQFREGLRLLKVDANGQKQQREAQVLTDASTEEVAKDKVGVSHEENAKPPKARTELAEESAPDQCIETAMKILAGEMSATTSNNLYMLDRQREDDTRNVCHSSTKGRRPLISWQMVPIGEKPATRVVIVHDFLPLSPIPCHHAFRASILASSVWRRPSLPDALA